MSSLIQAEVQFDPQGHLVIPTELILEKRESIRQRLKARFANIPAEVSLADELIADRRCEASQDSRS